MSENNYKEAPYMSVKEVRRLVRERIRTAQLPVGPGDKVYGGYGTNSICACCGRTVARHQIEYEVHFNSSPSGFHTHLDCYRIWWEEWSKNSSAAETRQGCSGYE